MTPDEVKKLKVAYVSCLDDFTYFTRYSFKQQYRRKWQQWDHLIQIADALKQVIEGRITRLIINVFPRGGKCISLYSMIRTTKGMKLASEIIIGDLLYSHDEGRISIKKCVGTELTEKESVRIKMKSGREIECSYDHPMLTTFGYKQANKITPKERILALNSLIEGDLSINNDELTFITLMIFEGNCSGKNIRFSNTDKAIIDLMFSACGRLGIEIKQYHYSATADYVIMGGQSGKASYLLKKYAINGHLAYTKRIPRDWFSLNLKQRLYFIDLMFATDGYALKEGKSGITLANKGLIEDIQSMLSSVRIISTFSYKKNKYAGAWVLRIGRTDTQKLTEMITFFHKREKAMCSWNKSTYSILDTYPTEILGVEKMRFKTKNPPFKCHQYKDITRQKFNRLADHFPELRKYQTNDFYYDEVVSVEPIGCKPLIHLEVEGTHNYIANGLVSHNTELAVKMFIPYCLALNQSAKFIHLSYSDDLALDNSEQAKDLVSSFEYQQMFGVKLKASSKGKKKWYTNSGGGVYATSSGGQITGFGAGQVDPDEDELIEMISQIDQSSESWLGDKAMFGGAIIIDDPNKPDDADSELLRNRVNERYDSTISNRVNSRKTPIIILQQRTHENDLSGYLIRKQGRIEDGGIWKVLSMPSIKEDGTALCPEKFTLEELKALEFHNDIVFQRQHMQNPKPRAGLLFPIDDLHFFDTNDRNLEDPDYSVISIDPAGAGGGGDDFAASMSKLVGNRIHITDVIYNTKGSDHNEVAVQDLIIEKNPKSVLCESIMGFQETSKRIREAVWAKGWNNEYRNLNPRTNKHIRIVNRSSFIRNNFSFRSDWEQLPEYSKMMRNLTSYMKIQEPGSKNKHDDAPDNMEQHAQYYERNFPELWALNKIS